MYIYSSFCTAVVISVFLTIVNFNYPLKLCTLYQIIFVMTLSSQYCKKSKTKNLPNHKKNSNRNQVANSNALLLKNVHSCNLFRNAFILSKLIQDKNKILKRILPKSMTDQMRIHVLNPN